MIQLIAGIIFLVSVAGMIFVLGKKVPALIELPQNGGIGLKKPQMIANVQNKIKDHHFHLFEKQMLLHKFLSFIKVWTLRIETKIDKLLHGIRKKAQEVDKQVRNKK